MRFLPVTLVLALGCSAKVVDSAPIDASADNGSSAPDTGAALPDSGTSPLDTSVPPSTGCGVIEGESPAAGGATICSTTSKVDGCPTDNPCMAPVKQTGTRLDHRLGRLRLKAPDALLSLTSIAFDPNINPKCVNAGSESFNWLLRIDTAASTIQTGGARPSPDGKTFAFLAEKYDASRLDALCPGFVGPATPIDLAPVTAPITKCGTGFRTPLIPQLNVPVFDASGVPIILPLRELSLRVPSIPDATCIGSWDKRYWCDGDTLGWTAAGEVVAKITAEDADRVPIKQAGCQSLCAILVNDATKTTGKVCKRGPDGKVPEIGTTCAGGSDCKNAWELRATFGSYGITIK